MVIVVITWMTGFSFGIGLTYPLCGFLIARFGWRSVFYTTGTLGVMWCFIWWVLAFDAPQKHPRITRKELDYIECAIGDSIIVKKVSPKNYFFLVSIGTINELVFRHVSIVFNSCVNTVALIIYRRCRASYFVCNIHKAWL